MNANLDSSALAVLALKQSGHIELAQRLSAMRELNCHAFGYVELRLAHWRSTKFNALNANDAAKNLEAVEQLWRDVNLIELDPATIRRAGALSQLHQLRAYDAVHLAAAESLQRDVGKKFLRWFCFDAQLNQAAAAIGLVDGLGLRAEFTPMFAPAKTGPNPDANRSPDKLGRAQAPQTPVQS